MSTLTMHVPDHVRKLSAAEETDFRSLSGAPMVATSSVRFGSLMGYEGVRFEACLAAARSYQEAGVPQIVMFDQSSHHQVPTELARQGAIVVPTPRPGLATPYLDAAWLARLHAGPMARVLKAEGDKLITAGALNAIEAALHSYQVVVGDRTRASLESMTPIQQRTEVIIDATLALMFDIPGSASFGVQAYGPQGLDVLLGYENLVQRSAPAWNNWKYLVYVPATALDQGLKVGDAILDLTYDPAMIKAEQTPGSTNKRLEQLLIMLEGGFEICTLLGQQNAYRRPSEDRMAQAAAMLAALRATIGS